MLPKPLQLFFKSPECRKGAIPSEMPCGTSTRGQLVKGEVKRVGCNIGESE